MIGTPATNLHSPSAIGDVAANTIKGTTVEATTQFIPPLTDTDTYPAGIQPAASTVAIRWLATQILIGPVGNPFAFVYNAANNSMTIASSTLNLNSFVTIGYLLNCDSVAATDRNMYCGPSTTTIVGGVMKTWFTDVSTTHTDGTEDTLLTLTTVANALNVNGRGLRFEGLVSFVGHALATRQLKAYFGGTSFFDSTALQSTAGGNLKLRILIVRQTSAIVRCVVELVAESGASLGTQVTYVTVGSLTFSATNILALKGVAAGTGAASADITFKSGVLEWFAEGNG